MQERLSREFDLGLIATGPSVVDKLQLSRSKTEDACEMARHNPAEKPDINRIAEIKDQWIRGKIYWSLEYVAQY